MENALQNALKRRITMDYLSERSGPNFGPSASESKKFNFEVIQDKLDKFKTKLKKTTMNREALIDFVG
jgi:hypothetical protein